MDRVNTVVRRATMQAIRSVNTTPEMIVRRMVHRMGFRYRLHSRLLPGKPDLVFGRRRKVIFVHGCFWHQHSLPGCKLAHKPLSNLSYWGPKLERNQIRDAAAHAALKVGGWDVLTVWECETRAPELLEARIRTFLEQPN